MSRVALRTVLAITTLCVAMSLSGCGGPEVYVRDEAGEVHPVDGLPAGDVSAVSSGPGLTVRESPPAATPTPPAAGPVEAPTPCAPPPATLPIVVKRCRGGPLYGPGLPPPGVPFYVIDVECP